MNVFILTGYYPLKDYPINGIFIIRRVKKLKEHGIDLKLLAFHIKENFSYWFYKKIRRLPLNNKRIKIEVDGIGYQFIIVTETFLDHILKGNHWLTMRTNAVIKEITTDHYDLIHAHSAYPEGFIATLVKRITGIPCIISCHGSELMVASRCNPKNQKKIVFSLNNADKVFFPSTSLLNYAQELGYSSHNYEIFPTIGVDISVFSLMEKEKALKFLHLEQKGKKYVGFIGRLCFVKRSESLPVIFYHIAQKVQDVEFVIIGDGDLEDSVKFACAQNQISVHFYRYIAPDQIPFWMNAFDVLILPSRSEGLPNVVMEAQSCGCPVVGSDAGGIPEAIGFGGAVVESGSAFEERFADAVISILSDPPDREQVREWAQRFDSEEIIKKQIRVYEELIRSES